MDEVEQSSESRSLHGSAAPGDRNDFRATSPPHPATEMTFGLLLRRTRWPK